MYFVDMKCRWICIFLYFEWKSLTFVNIHSVTQTYCPINYLRRLNLQSSNFTWRLIMTSRWPLLIFRSQIKAIVTSNIKCLSLPQIHWLRNYLSAVILGPAWVFHVFLTTFCSEMYNGWQTSLVYYAFSS